jgi:hypothetical protein
MWSEALPAKVRRRGVAVVEAWADQLVAAWLDGLEEEITRTRERASTAQRRADEARATAAAVDVREPDELVAARAELEEVNRAIAEERTADDAAEAA